MSSLEPPSAQGSDVVAAAPAAEPRGLTLVAVLAIVAACLSIFGSLGGIAGMIAAGPMRVPAFPGSPGAAPPAEAVRRMVELQARAMEASLPVPLGVVAICALPLAVLVIVSAIGLRRRKRTAPRWLLRAAGALALAEVASMVLAAIAQIRMRPVMSEMAGMFKELTKDASAAGGWPAAIAQTLGAVVEGSMVAGLVFGIGWSLGKIVGLLYACHYTRKPEVRAWVTGTP
jgi:hypothetical protein